MNIYEIVVIICVVAVSTFGLSIAIIAIDDKLDDIKDELRRLNDGKTKYD